MFIVEANVQEIELNVVDNVRTEIVEQVEIERDYTSHIEGVKLPQMRSTAPVIKAGTITVTQGDSVNLLQGVSAWDAEDGDITSRVFCDSRRGSSEVGTFTLVYGVVDSDGNSADGVGTLIVKPKAEPTPPPVVEQPKPEPPKPQPPVETPKPEVEKPVEKPKPQPEKPSVEKPNTSTSKPNTNTSKPNTQKPSTTKPNTTTNKEEVKVETTVAKKEDTKVEDVKEDVKEEVKEEKIGTEVKDAKQEVKKSNNLVRNIVIGVVSVGVLVGGFLGYRKYRG